MDSTTPQRNIVGILIQCDSCGVVTAVSAQSTGSITKCKNCITRDYLDLDTILNSPATTTTTSQNSTPIIRSSKRQRPSSLPPTVQVSPVGLKDVNILAQLQINSTLQSEHDQWKQFIQDYPMYRDNKAVFLQTRAYQQLLHQYNGRFLIDAPFQPKGGNKQYRTRLQCTNCRFKSEELPCYRFIQLDYQCPRCANNEDKEEEGEDKSFEQETEPQGAGGEGWLRKRHKSDIHGADGKWYNFSDYIQLNRDKLEQLYGEQFRVVNVFRSKAGARFQGTMQCLFCETDISAPMTSLLHKHMECKHCMRSTNEDLNQNENSSPTTEYSVHPNSSDAVAAILASSLHGAL